MPNAERNRRDTAAAPYNARTNRADRQRGLGQQVGQAGHAELVARINELTAANQELAHKLTLAETDRDGLQTGFTEAQDDLISARQALRNMMRDQNRDAT